MPLDMYDLKPEAMVAYLRYNGYHFSKKMCEWAVKQMYKYDPSTKRDVNISFWDKEKVDALLLGQGIEVKNKAGYDHVYVANMARADFYKFPSRMRSSWPSLSRIWWMMPTRRMVLFSIGSMQTAATMECLSLGKMCYDTKNNRPSEIRLEHSMFYRLSSD